MICSGVSLSLPSPGLARITRYRPVCGSISTRSPPPFLAARTTRASSRSRKRLCVRGGRGVDCLRLDICPESAHLERRVSFRQPTPKIPKCSAMSVYSSLQRVTLFHWVSLQDRLRPIAVHKIFFNGGGNAHGEPRSARHRPRRPHQMGKAKAQWCFSTPKISSSITSRGTNHSEGSRGNSRVAPTTDSLAGGAPIAPASPSPERGERSPSQEWRQQLASSLLTPFCWARARRSVRPAAALAHRT